MGLGDFLSGVKDAAVNVAKGAAWVADPTHLDDIAEGVGKAGKFAVENPGKVWDTGFEVGRAVVKDQLDPVNLAINAGLLAATVATGGAAAPAFIAKLGMGAKSLEAGVAAAKGIDTAVDVAKGVQTGVKAVEAGSAALKGAKAVDTAADVGRAVKTGAKVVDTVGDVARGAETLGDVAQTAEKGGKLMRYVDKGLGLEPGKFGSRASNVLNPLENSRFGAAAMRQRGAQRMLEAGGEAPGLARQVGAAVLQGGGRGAGGPVQLAGMSDKVFAAQKMAARAGAVGKRVHQAEQLGRGVEVAADPMAAAEGQVTKAIDERAGTGSGYTDYGQTATDMYSRQGAGGNAFGGPPGGTTMSSATPGPQPSQTSQAADQTADSSQTTETVGGKKKGGGKNKGFGGDTRQHIWEGPRSQWAGGVASSYDWRTIDPLRKAAPIQGKRSGPSVLEGYRQQKSQPANAVDAAPTAPGTAVEQYMGDLNGQGAPANFSPEVPKSGMYALSAGQQPVGSAFPVTRMGEGGRSRHGLGNVRTAAQPIGAIGPGKADDNIIDVDSSSPEDFKFDQAGQGYFDFANMGSAAADVGYQSPVNPMYSQGSRTSRRNTGALGV